MKCSISVVRKDYSEGDGLKWLQSAHTFNILAYHEMVIDFKSLSPNKITWIVDILTERIKWTKMSQIIFHLHDHVRCVIKLKMYVCYLIKNVFDVLGHAVKWFNEKYHLGICWSRVIIDVTKPFWCSWYIWLRSLEFLHGKNISVG